MFIAEADDYQILSPPSLFIFGSSTFYEFITVVDTVAQEGVESFTIHLSATSLPAGVILQDTVTVNIEDITRESVAQITELFQASYVIKCLYVGYVAFHIYVQ